MSDESTLAELEINLPPKTQYQRGHSLRLSGPGPAAIALLVAELRQQSDPAVKPFIDELDGVVSAPVVTSGPIVAGAPAPGVVRVYTAEEAAAAMGVPAPAPAPVTVQVPIPAAVAVPQVPVAAAPVQYAPAPVAAPVAPVAPPAPGTQQQRVDGTQVGGTPGQLYPVSPGGGPLSLGGPCPKCGVVTFWQPAGIKFGTNDTFPAYYRCPNAKNHPGR